MSEVRGRMTDNWSPTKKTRESLPLLLPHVHYLPALVQFRTWYQDPKRVKVQSMEEWERDFMSWCAVREERWLNEHPEVGGQRPVEFDPITGMPINPKPMRFREKES